MISAGDSSGSGDIYFSIFSLLLMATSGAVNVLAVVCFLCLSHSIFAHLDILQKSQLEHVRGLKIGDKTGGVRALKKYLHQYGYLDDNHLNTLQAEDRDRFDRSTDRAIKTFQLNFNLKPTGVLDDETISLMTIPRCGFPDIINGTTRMNAAGKYKLAAYSLNQAGLATWPPNRRSLTWAVAPGTRRDAVDPLAKFSIEPWSVASGRNFTFRYNAEKYNSTEIDVKISFRTKATDPALDGRGGVIAYGTPPTEGILVFDADETWAPGPATGAYDIGRGGLHEMGHIPIRMQLCSLLTKTNRLFWIRVTLRR